MGYIIPQLKDSSLFISRAYVNGEWIEAKSGEKFEVHDPATGILIGTCPECSVVDVEKAILAAAEAFSTSRKMLGRQRARILQRWYQLVIDNAEDLASLITWENGKPLAEARDEITYAASFLEWFSEEAPRIYGDAIPSVIPEHRIITVKEPVGVCALITPCNFPAAMVTRKIAPALAAANALVELAHRAGVPKGFINIVTAMDNTAQVGKLLTTDSEVHKVSFTGSTNVGRILMEQAASTIKKAPREPGGNAPFIVFDDVENLDAAVDAALIAKFRNSGQTCVCANRIYIQSRHYEEFAKRLSERVKKFKLGPGFLDGVTYGPLIHKRALEKVDEQVRDAVSKGATIIAGGKRCIELGPTFYEPTVLTGMTQDMLLASEETFGPVAGLFSFETEQDVVNLANLFRVAEALNVGMIGVNTGRVSEAASPFGGVKQSGFGREGSKYGIEEYVATKTITFGGLNASGI
ncbi:Aldehyde/histidinol dehydrogenase [Trichoderma asperelloides]|nr:Aldehyde/histidinol dehydrogenase [Trichoderma asperelloides]